MILPDLVNRSINLTTSTDDGQELQEMVGPDREIIC